ncbi:unnamed protein product [marine sediment metagenome]|uniref:Uncharacterized protein n=1 Tax=marine sediment metagenome TaxID=412755 RepID=X1S639_9ZZZZ
MIIPCFRCGKELETPNASNADYIMTQDMIETIIEDGTPKDIQKTGIICPECYKPTDFLKKQRSD